MGKWRVRLRYGAPIALLVLVAETCLATFFETMTDWARDILGQNGYLALVFLLMGVTIGAWADGLAERLDRNKYSALVDDMISLSDDLYRFFDDFSPVYEQKVFVRYKGLLERMIKIGLPIPTLRKSDEEAWVGHAARLLRRVADTLRHEGKKSACKAIIEHNRYLSPSD